MNGIEIKNDLKKLNERYSGLDESQLKTGLTTFARYPSDEATFLVTRLWDKHVPKWRDDAPPVMLDPQLQNALRKWSPTHHRFPLITSGTSANSEICRWKARFVCARAGAYIPEELEQRIVADEKRERRSLPADEQR